MRAATRVNVEPVLKTAVRGPTLQRKGRRSLADWEASDICANPSPPGPWRRHARKMEDVATPNVLPMVDTPTGTPRGAGWVGRMPERLVLLKAPGKVGRGKEPKVGRDSDKDEHSWKRRYLIAQLKDGETKPISDANKRMIPLMRPVRGKPTPGSESRGVETRTLRIRALA